MPGELILVATPLGHLGDITVRSLTALRSVDAIVCEDTRRTLKLLSAEGLHKPLLSMPAFDEARRIEPILARLRAGAVLALVSDAGSVGISDPGQRLVAAVLEAGVRVTVLPGPSAVIAALQASGLPSDRFAFLGFLPRKGQERQRALEELAESSMTSIIYESPRRLGATLSDLAGALGIRRAAVVRELTKIHEEVARGTLQDLAIQFGGDVLGEVTVVIEGSKTEPREVTGAELDAQILRRRGEGLGARELARTVARDLAIPTRAVYQRALKLRGDRDG